MYHIQHVSVPALFAYASSCNPCVTAKKNKCVPEIRTERILQCFDETEVTVICLVPIIVSTAAKFTYI